MTSPSLYIKTYPSILLLEPIYIYMHGREVTKGEVAPLALSPVYSVLLCKSVRNRTHPLYEITHKQLAGEIFLSQSAQSSLSIFAHSFEPTEGLRHTENTEAFQLRLAVTFCEIG